MRILGVDPGLSGGAALLDCADRAALPRLEVEDIPIRKERNSTGKQRGYIDAIRWRDLIRRWQPDVAYFELTWAMPDHRNQDSGGELGHGQGVVAAGRTQRSHGVLEGILICECEVIYVMPQVWKRKFGLIGGVKNKRSSCDLITELFPEAMRFFARAKDNNRAEAALLAVYGAAQRGLIRLAPVDATAPQTAPAGLPF